MQRIIALNNPNEPELLANDLTKGIQASLTKWSSIHAALLQIKHSLFSPCGVCRVWTGNCGQCPLRAPCSSIWTTVAEPIIEAIDACDNIRIQIDEALQPTKPLHEEKED